MPVGTDEFLDMLSRRGHEPLLEKVDATVRFDVADGDRIEHWRVQIARGDIAVTADEGPADAVISGDRATFDAIASGRLSMLAAMLRGVIGVDGDLELVVLSRRLIFPRTDSARRPGAAGEEQAS